MNLKRIWAKEFRKRQRNQARVDRVNRNWPFHAQRAIEVFDSFIKEAAKDGVPLQVVKSDSLKGPTEWKSVGYAPLGESSVALSFMLSSTGSGVISPSGKVKWDIETGSSLIIHHSSAEGMVQVFFAPAQRESSRREKQWLLFTHTFNTDDITYDWVVRLISKFLIFNRVESELQRSSFWDRARVRWWRFFDIRNRRGYLEKLQNILTPWEVLVLGTLAALPFAALLKMADLY